MTSEQGTRNGCPVSLYDQFCQLIELFEVSGTRPENHFVSPDIRVGLNPLLDCLNGDREVINHRFYHWP